MKWLIASDIHGSDYYCKKLLERFEIEQADKLLLLGDILYHGPRNDLPKDYNPKKVIEQLNAISDKILCVRGNCEAEVDQMVLDFPIMADYCILCVKGNSKTNKQKTVLEVPIFEENTSFMSQFAKNYVLNEGEHLIYATHGHLFGEEHPPKLHKGDILLCGHTHIPKCTEYENYTYMNPGSVSIPKNNSHHGYMILEDGMFSWKDVESGELVKICEK